MYPTPNGQMVLVQAFDGSVFVVTLHRTVRGYFRSLEGVGPHETPYSIAEYASPAELGRAIRQGLDRARTGAPDIGQQSEKPETDAILRRLKLRSRTEMARMVATIYVIREGERYTTKRDDEGPESICITMHAPTDAQLGATALAEVKLHRPAELYAAQRLRSIRARKCDSEMTDDDEGAIDDHQDESNRDVPDSGIPGFLRHWWQPLLLGSLFVGAVLVIKNASSGAPSCRSP